MTRLIINPREQYNSRRFLGKCALCKPISFPIRLLTNSTCTRFRLKRLALGLPPIHSVFSESKSDSKN